MGGSFDVTSVPGKGSTFTIRIPAVVVDEPGTPVIRADASGFLG